MLNKSKKLRIIIKLNISLVAIVLIFISIFSIGSNSSQRHIDSNYHAISESPSTFYLDDDGYYTFIKSKDRDFKILQLTDSHIGGGFFSIEKDKKAYDAIYKVVNATKPDLIIFTGDITYPFPLQSGNINNIKTAKQVASFMEKLQIPWTITFGNHDVESYSLANRQKLADLYMNEQYQYCIFTKNPQDIVISGYGNQIINIRNEDNSLNTSLVIFDSNAYINNNMFVYDIIQDNQVEWYKDSILALSNEENGIAQGEVVPSLAFFHIPLNEYQTAWDLHQEGSDKVQYLYGVKDENILAPTIKDNLPKGKLFDEMVELGSTKATFCGHNHKNNFAIVYEGIQLSYSNSIVYLGLFGIHKTYDYRGGTLINVGDDSSFSSELVYVRDIEE